MYEAVFEFMQDVIEDAMRCDTAAPALLGLASCDPFRHVVLWWLVLVDPLLDLV